ncbi:MAG: Fe3+/siderophore ABC transporter permease [Candidatus Cloacimonadota bacterium]|nr:MAG: Fe3+/siderophore ABC transporter permease [Candidatus Cloacimonadota bacterium]
MNPENKFKSKFFVLLLILAAISVWYLGRDFHGMMILTRVRIPRYVLAVFTGFVLGSSGTILQGMLGNPLAEPYILGSSGGAALGSAVAVLTGTAVLAPVFGFVGTLISVLLVISITKYGKLSDKSGLLLSGIVTGMFFSALISLLMYLNKEDIGAIFNVLMGNLGRVFTYSEWHYFLISIAFSALVFIYLYISGFKLDIMASGDDLAQSMGINVRRTRIYVFIAVSFLTAVTVSYAGMIGFVGLIVPHLSRKITGVNQRRNMIFAGISGSVLLLICDFLGSGLMTVQIPAGVITSFLGAPFFLFTMMKANHE